MTRHYQPLRRGFGLEYWLGRCDGFAVFSKEGRQGQVDEIVEECGVVRGVSVRWGDECARVDEAQILDVDPVTRTVIVDEGLTEGGI